MSPVPFRRGSVYLPQADLRKAGGFTLVELIVTLIIVGILAAFIMPRFFERGGFEARGFFDQTQAVIRYAQKTAIAQRRAIFVSVAANNVRACFAAACADADLIPDPSGQNAAGLSVDAPSGVTITAGMGNFSFNAQGKPTPDNQLTITLNDSRNIIIERETGYVHKPSHP